MHVLGCHYEHLSGCPGLWFYYSVPLQGAHVRLYERCGHYFVHVAIEKLVWSSQRPKLRSCLRNDPKFGPCHGSMELEGIYVGLRMYRCTRIAQVSEPESSPQPKISKHQMGSGARSLLCVLCGNRFGVYAGFGRPWHSHGRRDPVGTPIRIRKSVATSLLETLGGGHFHGHCWLCSKCRHFQAICLQAWVRNRFFTRIAWFGYCKFDWWCLPGVSHHWSHWTECYQR
mmetsp:Transcript_12187/g.22675  ORF Transcript_12187/g.22675 Transcript_12187/m.22675 type:complete len:228 (+) Transcript_12187:946-1629(+)